MKIILESGHTTGAFLIQLQVEGDQFDVSVLLIAGEQFPYPLDRRVGGPQTIRV
jgi:hypothetical protein